MFSGGGAAASKTGPHIQTYTEPLLCQRLGDTMSPTVIVGPAWVAPGLLCVSQRVCHTKGVPAWATICHPHSQAERGGCDPWPLKPPVGPFSQSHADRAPCLKSHGCLSGIRMEGGGWVGQLFSLNWDRCFVKMITCMLTHICTDWLHGWIRERVVMMTVYHSRATQTHLPHLISVCEHF